jgi:hypothetical protein
MYGKGGFVRTAILIFVAILAFATTPARAQVVVCSGDVAPDANTGRLANRLNVTDRALISLSQVGQG